MSMKKFVALFVALVMALSMTAVTASAEGTPSVLVTTSTPVFEGTEFTLDIVLTPAADTEKLTGFQIDFTFDAAKAGIVDDGFGGFNYTIPYDPRQLVTTVATLSESTISFGYASASAAGLDIPADGILGSIEFVAEEGSEAVGQFITEIADIIYVEAVAGEMKVTSTTLGNTTTIADLVVNEMPEEPSVSALGFSTDEPRHEGEITAAYTFNDGAEGTANDAELDGSEVKWYVEGTEASIFTGKTLAIDNADWVGKTLTYTVAPKVKDATRPNYAATGEPVATTTASAVIKAASDYALTAEVSADFEETDEIIATLPATVTVVLDDTYEAAVDASEYAWYILPLVTEGDDYTAETAIDASLEGIEASASAATATFQVANKDQWVVVVVTPKATIAGETFAAEAVKLAAKISGEPPVLDENADGSSLVSKKLFTTSSITITEKQVKYISNAVGDDDSITYTYSWYLATSLEDESPVEITGDAIQRDGAQLRLSKVEGAEGKYLVLVVTGTDALGIPASVKINFANAIAKTSGGSGTPGGASLITGTNGPATEEPGEEPTVNPADPSGDAIANGAAAFTDVDKEAYAWAYEGIDALAKAGVIKGMTESTFGPELTTTNAQVIALAVRIAGLTAEDATTDAVDAEHWVYEELAIAEANEILGVFGEAIDVEAATTREVAFTLLYNALKAAGVELSADAEAIEYSDAASIDAACVEAIEALTKAGIVNGMGDGTLAPKATITRAQLAKILGMAYALIG